MEAGAISIKSREQGDLADLDLQDAIFALGDVVALAKAVQLHLGLPSGHVIRGTHEVSVHVKQHNIAGCVKHIAFAAEILLNTRENGRQSSAIAIFRKASLTKFFWRPAAFRHQSIAIFLYRAT